MSASIRKLGRIEPKRTVLLAAWPGMGNVAYGAAAYLKENLMVEKFAEIEPEGIFYKTGVQIKQGIVSIPELPRGEFYFYRNEFGSKDPEANDIIMFIGESQPVMEKEYDLARGVVEVAKEYSVSQIITFAATPVNITHHSDPEVWGVSTDPEILNKFPGYGLKTMTAGHIGGLNGLLLGVGREAGIKGVCFLGEIPFYTAKIENPKSSLAILKVFMKYTGVKVDTNGLDQMAKYVEEEIDKVSKTTKQTLFGEEVKEQHGKEEGELETARNTIPHGIREKIEYMFEACGKDISKAGELKRELDKWELFGEYEDRFLDLFGEKNL
jgi:proteasome assembly chaperone (PAC2) family protein